MTEPNPFAHENPQSADGLDYCALWAEEVADHQRLRRAVAELQAALNQDRKTRRKMNSRSLAALHNLNEAMMAR